MKRIIKAFLYSMNGLKYAWKEEAAFRQEVIGFTLLAPVAFYAANTKIEFSILIVSLFIIILAELANSALEAIVDRISEELHPLSKAAKDVGSAMVFVAIIQAITVWGIVILW